MNLSATSIILIAILSIGCSSHPFAQDWQWSKSESEADYQRISERNRERTAAQLEKIRVEHPEWDKAVSDEVLVIECVSNDRRTICEGR